MKDMQKLDNVDTPRDSKILEIDCGAVNHQ